MFRYGSYPEGSYHERFRKDFDYEGFNGTLISEIAKHLAESKTFFSFVALKVLLHFGDGG